MKDPHVNTDHHNQTDDCKISKRKDQRSFKRASEKKDKWNSKRIVDSGGIFVEEVYGNNGEKSLRFDPAASCGERIRPPGILNDALDMKMYSLPSFSGNVREKDHLFFEAAEKINNDTSRQATVYDNQQAFPAASSEQSSILLCKRSEGSLALNPRPSYINYSADPADASRKLLEESHGVVTEIKAIQQTRRLLANARERTRVHTISAAFEALRKQVPCYSYGQKLSKLAILRIACNYILALAQLANLDNTPDHSNIRFRECIEQCTRTLQAEGRSKKRKIDCEFEKNLYCPHFRQDFSTLANHVDHTTKNKVNNVSKKKTFTTYEDCFEE